MARETDRINELSYIGWSNFDDKRNLEAERAETQSALGAARMSSLLGAPNAKARIEEAVTAFREALNATLRVRSTRL